MNKTSVFLRIKLKIMKELQPKLAMELGEFINRYAIISFIKESESYTNKMLEWHFRVKYEGNLYYLRRASYSYNGNDYGLLDVFKSPRFQV